MRHAGFLLSVLALSTESAKDRPVWAGDRLRPVAPVVAPVAVAAPTVGDNERMIRAEEKRARRRARRRREKQNGGWK